MQKTVIKAGQSKRYHVAMAYIDYLKKSNQYEGVLLLGDLKKPMSKKATSKIQVTGDDKTVIEKMLKDIAAVFPPNAPFMAVLGDQKHGTNIEAPLDTIKQAVAEVIGNTRTGGGTYTFIGQINRRTLFEEVISEAKAQQLNTGFNPFELA